MAEGNCSPRSQAPRPAGSAHRAEPRDPQASVARGPHPTQQPHSAATRHAGTSPEPPDGPLDALGAAYKLLVRRGRRPGLDTLSRQAQ